jgi:hypothetical protein
MKNIYLFLAVLFSSQLFAQTKGLTYQAVIYQPSGEIIPGVNNSNAPIANQNICLQFSILNEFSQLEYQEKVQIATDEFGMVNLVIGNGTQTGGFAANFSAIAWGTDQKILEVNLDVDGQCSAFVQISSQKLEYIPYAFYAQSTETISGIVPIENGGTNATTIQEAKVNLGLDNVDNTSDLDKPISLATQAALDSKENISNKSVATNLGTSDVLYPTQNAVKTYVDAGLNTANAALQTATLNNQNAIAAVQADVDQNELDADAADLVLQNNINALQNTVNNNATANTAALNLKENTANKSTSTTLGTSNVLFPTQNAVKTYVDGNINTVNANTAALQATVATNALNAINAVAAVQADVDQNELDAEAADAVLTTNLATEVTNRTNADLLKENLANKSTTIALGTSDVLYPTQNAVKTYVDASAAAGITGLNNEAAIRAAADATLTTNLATEVTNRTNADATLTTNLNAEAAARTAADATLTTNLATEVTNRTNADAALTTNLNAEASARTAADATLTTNLATEVTNRTNADAALTTNLNAEASARTAADATLTTNLATEVTNRTNVDLLKEDLSNKSTAITLGTSDVLYPTQNAVKSYVDTQLNNAAIPDATTSAKGKIQLAGDLGGTAAAPTVPGLALKAPIASPTFTGTPAAPTAAAGTNTTQVATTEFVTTANNTITTNLNAEAATRAAADVTLTANLNAEAATRAAADATLASDLATEVTNRTSANATLTTNLNAEASARTAADATLTTNLATEVTNRTNADLLKEELSNKSTATTLGTSDVLYPTQNAVKTYVDAQVTSGATPDATISAKGKIQLAGDLGGTAAAPTVPDLALKAPIASPTFTGTPAAPTAAAGTNTTQVATTEFVTTANNTITTNLNAEAATRAAADATLTANLNAEAATRAAADATLASDLATEVTNRTSADATLTTNLNAEASARTAADATLTNNLATEVTNRTNADLLKEDLSNKSTATTLGTSDVLYPTQNAVKTYVDAQVTSGATPDATTSAKGKIQLAGDLGGTAAAPVVAANAITTSKIVDGAVTDSKITAVSGSKVSGNIAGSAANVTGTVAVANGGTGQTTISGVKAALGLSGTSVAIGASSGVTNQGAGAVGIGNGTGQTNQGSQSVAIGYVAGNSNQGANSVAIGSNAAQGGQGAQAVAIGLAANSGANNSTALGAFSSAGHTNATAIGYQAVTSGNNTIQLGADGVTIAGSTAITNVKTSGTLTAGTVTYPNTHNSVAGQVLTTNASGVASWAPPAVSASTLSGTVAIANGGTGSTTATGALSNLGAAPIASPTFTGTPTAPTASVGTNTTQVATTAFVTNAITTSGLPSQSGNSGKYLTTNGSAASWASSPGVPYSGATGAVNLGSYTLTVHDIQIGRGGGQESWSTAVGKEALLNNGGGVANSAFGYSALKNNSYGVGNAAFGDEALRNNVSGQRNTAIGHATLVENSAGSFNTIVGADAAYSLTGSENTAIGANALQGQTSGNGNTGVGYKAGIVSGNSVYTNSTFIGNNARPQSNNFTNATAIGYNAIATASDAIQLGNTSVTNVKTSGTLTAGMVTYPNAHGTTGQVLSTTGSGTLTWVSPSASSLSGTVAVANGGTGLSSTPANGQIDIGNGTGFTRATLTAGTAITITNNAGAITISAAVRPTTDQATATAAQTSFTLAQTPMNTKVWMFINGVRTNNNAYTVSGSTVTYTPANNNGYVIVVGDRIQFDYCY